MIKKLFGGAIEAKLPDDAIDVSGFRQVPDNQEVFLLEQGEVDKSIIIELLEQPPGDIQQVLQTHLSDLLEDDNIRPVEYTTTTNSVAESNFLTVYKDKVTTIVALIRLNKVHTDILISINLPAGGDYSLDIKVMEQIISSFKITDWRLFG